ncbi:hypothetical protein KC950_04065 [Candidatus Saccharibacteria bacterium]|nr:hypothetical protein [Candidatus Saccharibacteria bacterium]
MNNKKVRLETVVEAPFKELYSSSGVVDDSGQELTNIELATSIAQNAGAYGVFISMNGQLSPEANRHNTEVTRSGVGDYIVALVAKYNSNQQG